MKIADEHAGPRGVLHRRDLLRLSGLSGTTALVSACSSNPAVTPTAAPVAKPASPPQPVVTTAPVVQQPGTADWDKIVDAANGEGPVVVNWILSKEGGVSWTRNVQQNSRRREVPVYDAETFPGADFAAARCDGFFPSLEEDLPLQQAAIDQLKQLIVS